MFTVQAAVTYLAQLLHVRRLHTILGHDAREAVGVLQLAHAGDLGHWTVLLRHAALSDGLRMLDLDRGQVQLLLLVCNSKDVEGSLARAVHQGRDRYKSPAWSLQFTRKVRSLTPHSPTT